MSDDTPRPLSDARASVLGFFAGLMNGLIAIGGGIIITPGLVVYGRASPEIAVGTSLAAVVVLSSVAFLMHASFGGLGLNPYAIAVVVAAGMFGALVGGWMLARLSASWMLFLFSVFLLVMSIRLLVQALGVGVGVGVDIGSGAGPGEWHGAPPWWSYPLIGFISGILSGVFGVGGGAAGERHQRTGGVYPSQPRGPGAVAGGSANGARGARGNRHRHGHCHLAAAGCAAPRLRRLLPVHVRTRRPPGPGASPGRPKGVIFAQSRGSRC